MLAGVVAIFAQIGALSEEAAIRLNLAFVQAHLGQLDAAIAHVERSLALLTGLGLPQDAAGRTVEQHRDFLAQLQAIASRQSVGALLAAPGAGSASRPPTQNRRRDRFSETCHV